MKKLLFFFLAVSIMLPGCTKDPTSTEGKGWNDEKALKLRGDIVTVSGLDLTWEAGQEFAVFPVNANVVATKASPSIVKMVAASAGSTSDLKYVDYGFMPDKSITRHKFAALTPYVSSGTPEAADCLVPAEQSGTLSDLSKFVPMYSTAEIVNPVDGAIVLMKFSAAVAIIKVPVTTGTDTVIGMTLETEEGASPIGGAFTINLNDGSISLKNGLSSIAVSTSLPASETIQYYYVAVLPGDHTGKELHAKLSLSEGEREIVLEGDVFKAGTVTTLKDITPIIPPPSKEEVFEIDMADLTFDESFIYEAKDETGRIVAVIAKEYLGKATNQQAIVIYGTKPNASGTLRVIDSENTIGFIAQVLKAAAAEEYTTYESVSTEDPVHGGLFSFKKDEIGYITPGSAAAVNKVYAVLDSESGVTTISTSTEAQTTPTTLVPRTYVFTDRGDEKAYKLVKICRQIWFAEDVATYKFNDGMAIPKVKAAELFPLEGPGCVNTANTTDRLMYNAAATNNEKFVPASGGWKVPTIGDFKTLIAEIPMSGMITNIEGAEERGNNITGLSIHNLGRVTNKSWSNTKSMDPCYWSSNASETEGQHQCLVVRSAPTSAPVTNNGQNSHFGFFVRLMRGLY